MPLIFLQLRWNDVSRDRYEEIVRALPQDGDLPPGCLSRQLRREGGALTAKETWDSETSGGRMDDLVTALRAAGVHTAPQTAMFSMPAMFGGAYRRPGGAVTGQATAVPAAIPGQRNASAREPGRADAYPTVSS